MADRCKTEKKALDEAERNSTTFENWMNRMDKSADEWEAEAQQELGSIGECTGATWHPATHPGGMRWLTWGEYLDEKCVIDKWVTAHELLEDALNARKAADDYMTEWVRWDNEASKREKKYCDCLNETPG